MNNVNNQKVTEEQNDQVITNDQEIEKIKKRRKSRSFNVKLGEADLLAHAIGANQELLAAKGAGEAFVEEFKEAVTAVKDINKEQEKHKALQKVATAKLYERVKIMDRLVWEARNYVKIAVPKERWIEFGILAKR